MRAQAVSNLVVLPGLGTFLAGRRLAGVLQALLALIGMMLSLAWFFSWVDRWLRSGEFPWDGGPYLRLGLIGVGLFALAWVGALVTSLAILRAARRSDL